MNEVEHTPMPHDESDDMLGDESPRLEEAPPADPVAGLLLRIALTLIIIVLVTAATMLFALRGRHGAPRSVAERDVATWEAAVREKPSVALNWTKLVYAYSESKRYSDALKAARQGRSVTGENALWLAEADVLRASRRYAEAIKAYDAAEKAITEAESSAKSKLQQEGIYVALGEDSLAFVHYGRAIARHEIGDDKKAIEDLRKATAEAPEQAQMQVLLGDYLREAGDAKGSEAAYRAALKYVPDYPEALVGLKKLGAE